MHLHLFFCIEKKLTQLSSFWTVKRREESLKWKMICTEGYFFCTLSSSFFGTIRIPRFSIKKGKIVQRSWFKYKYLSLPSISVLSIYVLSKRLCVCFQLFFCIPLFLITDFSKILHKISFIKISQKSFGVLSLRIPYIFITSK